MKQKINKERYIEISFIHIFITCFVVTLAIGCGIKILGIF